MHKIRMFIISEPQGVRQGLSAIFSSENSFHVVGEASCRLEHLTEIQKLQPDAILYDITSGEDVLSIIRHIKDTCPCTLLFALLDYNTIHEAHIAISAGVDSFLTKTLLPSDLVKAVELTCRTGILCIPDSLRRMVSEKEKLIADAKLDALNEAEIEKRKKRLEQFPLTAREMEIYKLVVKNLSNKEIGKKLYISQPTVKSHMSSILRKLGLSKRTQLILFELENHFLGDSFTVGNEAG